MGGWRCMGEARISLTMALRAVLSWHTCAVVAYLISWPLALLCKTIDRARGELMGSARRPSWGWDVLEGLLGKRVSHTSTGAMLCSPQQLIYVCLNAPCSHLRREGKVVQNWWKVEEVAPCHHSPGRAVRVGLKGLPRGGGQNLNVFICPKNFITDQV